METIITTKAIENILRNPKKLNSFSIPSNRNNDDKAYELIFAYRCYTIARLNETNEKLFEKFNELNKDTTADFGYFCQQICSSKNFPNCDFEARPILELYEALLKENWNAVKRDRDILNAKGALDRTPEVNIKICEAIVEFLKEHVINKTATTNNIL